MDPTRAPIDVVINPAARGGRSGKTVDEVVRAFRDAGREPHLHRGSSREDTIDMLHQLAQQGPERVVLVGGDGLAHLGANAFAHSDTTIGIVPAGSGNDAARALGLPRRLDRAVVAALDIASPIDLLEAEGSVALTIATAGFSGAVSDRADRASLPIPSLSYLGATLLEFPGLRDRPMAITLDGRRWELDTPIIGVANMAYFGSGMKIAPDADPTDGELDIVIGLGANHVRYARLLPQVFFGRHVRDDFVLNFRVREVSIEVLDDAPLELWADGEKWLSAPVTLRCRPDALAVAGVGPI